MGRPRKRTTSPGDVFRRATEFDSFVQSTKGNTWSDAFEEVIWLGTSNLDGDEPFGFADGISQPQIDWDQQRQTPCTQLEYTNVVALGEFLLGYRNEYGKITDRPLLDPDAANAELLPAVDAPEKKDLGRNGTLSCHATIGTGRPRLLEVSL